MSDWYPQWLCPHDYECDALIERLRDAFSGDPQQFEDAVSLMHERRDAHAKEQR